MSKSKKYLGKYVDPRTDFGWKFYFGREENKILLIEFLNSLFQGQKTIVDLRYKPVELDGDQEQMRRVVFDLHCIGTDGEIFIIEMQQLYQEFFKDRAVYYTSRLINKQLLRGKASNNYQLPEVYFIGILEFPLHQDDKIDQPYFYDVALCDIQTKEIFYDKLGYKMISLPLFNKKPEELLTIRDQWLYLLKHLSTMDKLPAFLDKRIFGLIFELGQVGKLTEEDLMSYEASLKHKRDTQSVLNTARKAGIAQGLAVGRAEGKAKGLAEGLAEGLAKGLAKGVAKGEREKAITIALEFKKMGLSVADIAKGTGLSIEEIEKL